MHKTIFLAAAALVLGIPAAEAHVTLEQGEAVIGSTYKAVLRVPHGCDGSATLKVRVKVPEGMFGVKPMPKAGWTLETVKGKYAATYTLHGAPVSEGVVEIVWSGNLPDDYYDEFVLRGTLADSLTPGERLYFPVVQECENGAERWIDIPAAGADPHSLKYPAPGLKLLPRQ